MNHQPIPFLTRIFIPVMIVCLVLLAGCAVPGKVDCPKFEGSGKPAFKRLKKQVMATTFSHRQKHPQRHQANKQSNSFKTKAYLLAQQNLVYADTLVLFASAESCSLKASNNQKNVVSVPTALNHFPTKTKKRLDPRCYGLNRTSTALNRSYSAAIKRSFTKRQPLSAERRSAIVKGGAILLMAIIAGITLPLLGTTAASIGLLAILVLDILISFGIYRYYRNKKPKLAASTAGLRGLYSAIFSVGIGFHLAGNVAMFTTFWQNGLIVFGLHLIALGILYTNEGGKKWVNVLIKSLLIAAGIGYLLINIGLLLVANPLAYAAMMESIFIGPMVLGEVLFALWMIFKGAKSKQNDI